MTANGRAEPAPEGNAATERADAEPAGRLRRGLGRVLLALLLLGVGLDWTRAPAQQWTARGEVAAIHLYQRTLSPVLARGGVRCRFRPSCSHYAEAVIREDGALVGTLRAAWRLLRCGPWTPAGTVDPP
jgi:putative membrane protein insertion efficiency factor